ncbi:MAG: hypothetical protein KIT14_05080 [bacterium]|nr:hypothetical protein [bacterium]
MNPLDTLATLIDAASGVLTDMSAQTYLPRLLQFFRRLPVQDREAVLGVLEREVEARRLSVEAGDGRVGEANPLASLYVRVFDAERPLPVVSRDEMTQSTIQATALMASFPEPLLREMEAAMGEAVDLLTPEEAAALLSVHEEILELAAEEEADA